MELEDVGVSKMKYCKQNQFLFVGDFKGYLKCYDISQIIKNLNENIEYAKKNSKKKVDKHTLYTSMREYFQFDSDVEPEVVWNVKATSDQITHLEYDSTHKLLFICTSEKNVFIFDSEKGQYIEQLRQNEEIFVQKPIGYRMKNTIDLYDHSLKIRIDRTQEEDEFIERQKQQEYMNQMKKRIKQQKKLDMLSSSLNYSSFLGISSQEPEGSKEDRSQISQSKGSVISNNNNNIQISSQKITQIKEELDESENCDLLDENNKNIFLTNTDKKVKIDESTPVLSQLMGESMKSLDEKGDDQDIDESTHKNESVEKVIDDRLVYIKYPESEVDAFFFCNLIKKEPYKSQKSKPQWKLEIDFKSYYEQQREKIKEIEKNLQDLQKKTKVIQLKNQQFKIIRFEVDLNIFDPQNDFQPIVQINQKNENIQADEDALDAKVIATNYQKQDKQEDKGKNRDEGDDTIDTPTKNNKQNFNQMWENLSKNKINCRYQDSEHFLNIITKKIKLSKEEEEKLLSFYNCLKEIEDIQSQEEKEKIKKEKEKEKAKQNEESEEQNKANTIQNMESKQLISENIEQVQQNKESLTENKEKPIEKSGYKRVFIKQNSDATQQKPGNNEQQIKSKGSTFQIKDLGKSERTLQKIGTHEQKIAMNEQNVVTKEQKIQIKEQNLQTNASKQFSFEENIIKSNTKIILNRKQSLEKQKQFQAESNANINSNSNIKTHNSININNNNNSSSQIKENRKVLIRQINKKDSNEQQCVQFKTNDKSPPRSIRQIKQTEGNGQNQKDSVGQFKIRSRSKSPAVSKNIIQLQEEKEALEKQKQLDLIKNQQIKSIKIKEHINQQFSVKIKQIEEINPIKQVEIQQVYSHQHSVSSMIAQAFKQSNQINFELDSMVKRITTRHQFISKSLEKK